VTFAFPRVTQHSSHLARCCDTDQATGSSNALTIEGYIRGTGMSKQSVVKKSFQEVSSTSEFSIGDKHWKCDHVKMCSVLLRLRENRVEYWRVRL
jgi:hypothetical protein